MMFSDMLTETYIVAQGASRSRVLTSKFTKTC